METNTDTTEKDTTAITEQLTNPSVIAAVEMNYRKRTPFDQFWAFYMTRDQQAGFSYDAAAFAQACNVRRRWLGR